jgi:hypothetical protein
VSTRAHIALAILAALAIVGIVRLVRRRHLKAKYSLLWLSLGGFMVIIAAVPGLLDWTANRLGIYYQPTLLILLGLALLVLIVVHFSYELTRMENRIRTLAEDSALLRHRLAQLESDRSGMDTPDETHGGPTED